MRAGWLFFNDKDNVLVDELMKSHGIAKSHKELVKAHFEEMLANINKDLSDETKD